MEYYLQIEIEIKIKIEIEIGIEIEIEIQIAGLLSFSSLLLPFPLLSLSLSSFAPKEGYGLGIRNFTQNKTTITNNIASAKYDSDIEKKQLRIDELIELYLLLSSSSHPINTTSPLRPRLRRRTTKRRRRRRRRWWWCERATE